MMAMFFETDTIAEKTDEVTLDCFEFIEQNHRGTLQLSEDELIPYAGLLNSICHGVDISDFAVEELLW